MAQQRKLDPKIFEADPHVSRWVKGQPMATQMMAQAVAIILKLQGDDVWEAFVKAMEPPDTNFSTRVHGHTLDRYMGHSRKSLALSFGFNAEQVDDIDAALRKCGQRITDAPAYATRVIEQEPTLDQQFRFPAYGGIGLSDLDVPDEQALELLSGNTLLLECLQEARDFVKHDSRRIAQLQQLAAKAQPQEEPRDTSIWTGNAGEPEPEPQTAA